MSFPLKSDYKPGTPLREIASADFVNTLSNFFNTFEVIPWGASYAHVERHQNGKVRIYIPTGGGLIPPVPDAENNYVLMCNAGTIEWVQVEEFTCPS